MRIKFVLHRYFGRRFTIALLELPAPIKFSQYIKPVKLTNVCDTPHLGGQAVIAAGMGLTEGQKVYADDRSKIRLREVNLITLASDYCSKAKIDMYSNGNVTRDILINNHRHGIICVEPNYAQEQYTARGDSGNCSLLTNSNRMPIEAINNWTMIISRWTNNIEEWWLFNGFSEHAKTL